MILEYHYQYNEHVVHFVNPIMTQFSKALLPMLFVSSSETRQCQQAFFGHGFIATGQFYTRW
jgi:site-specific recombinase XerC